MHFQVLWEMLTQEVPFKGLLGVQVAWLVVVEGEVNQTANMVCQSSITVKNCLLKSKTNGTMIIIKSMHD